MSAFYPSSFEICCAPIQHDDIVVSRSLTSATAPPAIISSNGRLP